MARIGNTWLASTTTTILLLTITTITTVSSNLIKEETFCSNGFAVWMNIDCYPNVVYVLKVEKGVLRRKNSTVCDLNGGVEDVEVMRPKDACPEGEASPSCANAFGLPKGHYVRVSYQCVNHMSVCGGSIVKSIASLHSAEEMAPAVGSNGLVYSPNYKGQRGNIPASASCSLVLKLPSHSQLKLSIKDFHLPRDCKTASLSVQQTIDADVDGGAGPASKRWQSKWHRCGSWKEGVIYTSGADVTAVRLVFNTYSKDKTMRGFVIHYNVTRREGVELMTTESTTLTPTSRKTTTKHISSSSSSSSSPSSSSSSSSQSTSTAAKKTTKPPLKPSQNLTDPTSLTIELGDNDEIDQTRTTERGFGVAEVIISVSAAGCAVIVLLGVACLFYMRRFRKNDQIFHRNVSLRYSNDHRGSHHRERSGSGPARDTLLQPYYMSSPNESSHHHKSLVRPSTTMSQYPIFAAGSDDWDGDTASITTYSTGLTSAYPTPTYNYQGIPTTEL